MLATAKRLTPIVLVFFTMAAGMSATAHASPGPSILNTLSHSLPTLNRVYQRAKKGQLGYAEGGHSWREGRAVQGDECESGGNTRAYNPSGVGGIGQIRGQVVPGNIFDVVVKALNAVANFTASGDTFAQWVCQ